jgi:hypothetical protein
MTDPTTDPPTDLVKVEPSEDTTVSPIPAPTRDVVVLASSPEEMATSQRGLIGWAEQKLAAEKSQLEEKEANLAHSKKAKYSVDRWVRQVQLAKRRVTYYAKILNALREGYYIVPNFPIQIIAVRTKRALPSDKVTSRESWAPVTPELKAMELPVGVGKYVNPTPALNRWSEKTLDSRGKEVTLHHARPIDYAEIDFPFSIVKPQVLSQLDRAMQLKIFDEIGVLPARQRNADPMVIGVIKRREGYSNHPIMFLISWWIDTRDL